MNANAVRPLKTRVIWTQLLTAGLVLLLGSLFYIANDLSLLQESLQSRTDGVAKILSSNLVSSIAFADGKDANQILSSLRTNSDVEAAFIEIPSNPRFATYGNLTIAEESVGQEPGFSLSKVLTQSQVHTKYLISQDDKSIGTLHLFLRMNWIAEQIPHYLGIVLCITVLGLGLAYIFAWQFQRLISEPVMGLLKVTSEISKRQDYGIRFAGQQHHESGIAEIDQLAKEFDEMLVQIQSRDQQIVESNSNLESKVEEKTRALVEAQASLVQKEKMSALGEMAAGIAHEINTPLTIILLKSTILSKKMKAKMPEDHVTHDDFDKISAMSTRISKIVNGLKSFSRDGQHDPFESAELKKIIDESVEFCIQKFKDHKIDFQIGPIPDLMIECRPTQISQVLLNMLNNAHDAIENLPQPWIRLDIQQNESADLEIWITDSGPGIPLEIRQKLMTMFFTTKASGKGTGMGLSISQRIVDSHQGTIAIDGECKNTRFVIRLPIRQSIAKAA